MLFQEHSSGNGPSEEMYGIFDPEQGHIILKLKDWRNGNRKEAEKILGYSPPFFGDKVFFCCWNQMETKEK